MTTVFIYEYATAVGARGESLAPSLLAEGRAMRTAVIADFQAIPDVRVLTVPTDDEAAFRRTAAGATFALIIAPESQGILEERCRWALESGTTLLGPSLEAIHLTSDKLALAKHFHHHGVPHPKTWPLGSEPQDLFPMVWKSRDGAGSQNSVVIKSANDSAAASASERKAMIAQEYIDGIAASVAFLIGSESRVALLPCRQNLSDDGSLRYLGGSLPLPADLSKRASTLAERAIAVVPGLFGYVGVDVVLANDPSKDCVIEINPRLTTSYVGLRRSARFNIAEELLRVVTGEPGPELAWWHTQVEFLSDGRI